ncbi:PIN-like domain-containing protein [Shewanella sp. 6_MG-2023]|uniref:PIN-like domain-containing protein n=1 Tax=Shewanella sp. 6_MG-2023 TaxID=3062660 RepID=UPI0026E2C005|nr:PIN-like domain-containing protein [Shewanella sp. 6_MG-2023]MDO6619779.1 PIN domain-containing protein [Shewanella sp. 6_MG-2023]
MSSNMRDLFPGYFKESEEDLKRLWEKSTFVFDANILLNMYRYSEDTRKDFLGLLTEIKGRVWVSHQASFEYLENRENVIYEQEVSYDETVKEMKALRTKFENNRQHPFVSTTLSDQLKVLFGQIEQELIDSKKTHSDRISNDPIKENLAKIFDGKVGFPYSDEELKTLCKEGRERYKQSIPPGYKDANKSDGADNLMSQRRKFGDFILWQQTMDMAKNDKADVIFITDDTKEDWWKKPKGKTIGPRPELTKEFIDKTDKKFQMYRADTFIHLASKYLDSKISAETVQEITQVRLIKDILPALRKYPPLHDLVFFLAGLDLAVESKLPSERDLSEAVGYNRTVIREQLVRLESFGFVEINHGKSTVLVKELPDLNHLD